jgi:hypothetical protein
MGQLGKGKRRGHVIKNRRIYASEKIGEIRNKFEGLGGVYDTASAGMLVLPG